MNKEKRQIESYVGSPPTNSLPLFLSCPRTLCYCDVHSSFLLLRSAVEAFCSPLIHTLPRYFHISEWTLCIELKFLWGKRRRGRWRRRKHHVWLHPSTSDFRSCWDRDQSSHESQAPQMELCHLCRWETEAKTWYSHFSLITTTVSLITKIKQFCYFNWKTTNIIHSSPIMHTPGVMPTQNGQ